MKLESYATVIDQLTRSRQPPMKHFATSSKACSVRSRSSTIPPSAPPRALAAHETVFFTHSLQVFTRSKSSSSHNRFMALYRRLPACSCRYTSTNKTRSDALFIDNFCMYTLCFCLTHYLENILANGCRERRHVAFTARI